MNIAEQILQLKREPADLDAKRVEIQKQLTHLDALRKSNPITAQTDTTKVTAHSPEVSKVALFRSLFHGPEDVYPKRFESKRTGRNGYQPVCRKEWIRPICNKPKVKCAACENRDFDPISDEVIRKHLLGKDPKDRLLKDFIIGVYPMLGDETCWFLTLDFDKETWSEDALAYLKTCHNFQITAYLERSKSGNGGHVWIFFSEPIAASFARQLGTFMLTRAMEARSELGFDSYDRFFPSQDTLPKGGFCNLIALPLQKRAREKGNSIFVDDELKEFSDQWAFLSSVQRMSFNAVQSVVDKAESYGGVLGVRFVDNPFEEAFGLFV